MSDKRPSRTSMEGMIWNANHILEQALSTGGIPKNLFEECKGIVLISIVQAGLMFSGSVGTGIALTKNDSGSWSPPCAVGVSGIGFGMLIGASVKDVLMFLTDRENVKDITSEKGLQAGTQSALILGTGHEDVDLSKSTMGMPISVAYTKGAFAGVSLQGAVIGARDSTNEAFYGEYCSPRDILLAWDVKAPEEKVTLLPEVYEKLNKCVAGATAEPTPAEEKKKAAAAEEAEKASVLVQSQAGSQVVQVDAAAEAAKEAGASASG